MAPFCQLPLLETFGIYQFGWWNWSLNEWLEQKNKLLHMVGTVNATSRHDVKTSWTRKHVLLRPILKLIRIRYRKYKIKCQFDGKATKERKTERKKHFQIISAIQRLNIQIKNSGFEVKSSLCVRNVGRDNINSFSDFFLSYEFTRDVMLIYVCFMLTRWAAIWCCLSHPRTPSYGMTECFDSGET